MNCSIDTASETKEQQVELDDTHVRSRLADESPLFTHDDIPTDGDLTCFYRNQIGVKGYVSDEHEETDDSDLEVFHESEDSDSEWNEDD